ncbi:MAG: hypothetical protein R3B60_04150 [Candidatus Paceibacterota bacterium]
MQIENNTTPESEIDNDYYANLKKVTPVSKYLAMALFVALPFIGSWIGYNYAPEKVVIKEVDDLVTKEESGIVDEKIVVSADSELKSGDYVEMKNSIINKYVLEGKELYTENTKIAFSDSSTFSDLNSYLIKIDNNHTLMRILYNPSSVFDDYLVHEPTHKVIKVINNVPRNILLDGIWYKGKNYHVSGSDVVESDYLTGEDKIIYTELNNNLSLVSECGVGDCFSKMIFDNTIRPALIVARYNKNIPFEDVTAGKIKSAEYFHDAIIIELP